MILFGVYWITAEFPCIKLIKKHRKVVTKYIFVLLLIIIVLLLLADVSRLVFLHSWNPPKIGDPAYPFGDDEFAKDRLELASWINQNLPEDSVLMLYWNKDINFHTGRKTVQIPYSDLDTILKVANYYDVSYIQYSPRIAVLDNLKTDDRFTLTFDGDEKLYKIEWEKINI
jgi:hypothetical protein